MNRQELLLKIDEYANLYSFFPKKRGLAITEIEKMLIAYLDLHPYDVEMWLKLICIEFHPPRIDFPIFEEYFQKVLAVEPNRPFIYVMKAHAEYVTRYIYPETYEQLCSVKTVTNDDKVMVAYMRSLVVPFSQEYEDLLLESVKYGSSYFHNHVALGRYYIGKDNIKEGRSLLEKGVQNVIHIYTENDFDDPTDLYELANEMIKGIHLPDPNFHYVLK